MGERCKTWFWEITHLNYYYYFTFFWQKGNCINEERVKGDRGDQLWICYDTDQLYQSLTIPKDPQADHDTKKKKFHLDKFLSKPRGQHMNWLHESNV